MAKQQRQHAECVQMEKEPKRMAATATERTNEKKANIHKSIFHQQAPLLSLSLCVCEFKAYVCIYIFRGNDRRWNIQGLSGQGYNFNISPCRSVFFSLFIWLLLLFLMLFLLVNASRRERASDLERTRMSKAIGRVCIAWRFNFVRLLVFDTERRQLLHYSQFLMVIWLLVELENGNQF